MSALVHFSRYRGPSAPVNPGNPDIGPGGGVVSLTVDKLPATMTAGTFALLAHGNRSLDFYGLFTGHQSAGYVAVRRAVYFWGAETHSDTNYYTNSPYHINLDTMTTYRDLGQDPCLGQYRIAANGMCFADVAHTRPWAMHGLNQWVPLPSSNEFVVAYPTTDHATITPIYESGSPTAQRYMFWYYDVVLHTWRYDDGASLNANVADFIANNVGYGVDYDAARGTLVSANTGLWKEINLTTYAKQSSSPSMIGGYNTYCKVLASGLVAAGICGSQGNTNIMAVVDPTNPAAFVLKTKVSYAALSAYSLAQCPVCMLPTGHMVIFTKDQTNNGLHPFIWDPVGDTMTNTGHFLALDAAQVDDNYYWQRCAYSPDHDVVILSNNANNTLSVWGYKPTAGA